MNNSMGCVMSEGTLKKQTIGGFIWRFAERCGAQGVQFIVSIVLAILGYFVKK